MNSIKWEIWILQKAWGVRKTHLTWATIQGEVCNERLMKKLLAHRGMAISFAHWGLFEYKAGMDEEKAEAWEMRALHNSPKQDQVAFFLSSVEICRSSFRK